MVSRDHQIQIDHPLTGRSVVARSSINRMFSGSTASASALQDVSQTSFICNLATILFSLLKSIIIFYNSLISLAFFFVWANVIKGEQTLSDGSLIFVDQFVLFFSFGDVVGNRFLVISTIVFLHYFRSSIFFSLYFNLGAIDATSPRAWFQLAL